MGRAQSLLIYNILTMCFSLAIDFLTNLIAFSCEVSHILNFAYFIFVLSCLYFLLRGCQIRARSDSGSIIWQKYFIAGIVYLHEETQTIQLFVCGGCVCDVGFTHLLQIPQEFSPRDEITPWRIKASKISQLIIQWPFLTK